MNIQKVLTTAVLGVGLGVLTLPGIAFANVGAHPSVAPAGTTITLTARCKPQAKAPQPSATFHITGPQKEQGTAPQEKQTGPQRESETGRQKEHDTGWQRDHATGPDKEYDKVEQKDVRVQSTGTEPKMPDTVSAQVHTNGWSPGQYHVSAKCSDGTHAGNTAFTLTPQGGPHSGGGGQSGDNAMIAAGTAMLGAGAIGFVLLRRRRPGTAIA